MKYAKYAEYKKSGVEWLGEVPAHWEVKRLKHASKILSGQSPNESTYNDLGNGKILINGPVEYSKEDFGFTRSLKWTTDPKQFCDKGVILVCLRGSTTGRLNITHENVAIGRGVAAVRSEEMQEYVNLYVQSTRKFIESIASGSTFPSITSEDLGNIPFPIPTVAEQRKISDFLNKEIPKIDTLIEKQEQLIKLLQEKRQAVISHAVTKGLNPAAKMKDSGVEWLGEVPAHWELRPLKYLCKFHGGGTPSKDNLEYWNGDIPWVSPKDMKTDIITDTKDHITKIALQESSTKLIPRGSVLIVVRSGILQHSIPVAINDVEVALNQDMKALLFSKNLNNFFVFNVIKGNQTNLLLEWSKQGATVESIEQEYLSNTIFPIPPVPEQRQIVYFIDKKVEKIDSLIDKSSLQVNLLKERRIALISAAVTGKIDVREAV